MNGTSATVNMIKDMSNRWKMCGCPTIRMSSQQAKSAVKTTSLRLDYREMAIYHDVVHIMLDIGTGLLHPGYHAGELRCLTVSEWFSDGEHRVKKSSDAIRLLCMVAEYKVGPSVVVNIRLDGGTVDECVTNSVGATDTTNSIHEAVRSFLKLMLAADAVETV